MACPEQCNCPQSCLDQGVIQAATNSTFSAITQMGLLDTLAHRNRMYGIFESGIGQITDKMNTLGPAEAQAQRSLTTSHLAEKLAELSAGLSGAMQAIKSGQTTPPITAPPPAV